MKPHIDALIKTVRGSAASDLAQFKANVVTELLKMLQHDKDNWCANPYAAPVLTEGTSGNTCDEGRLVPLPDEITPHVCSHLSYNTVPTDILLATPQIGRCRLPGSGFIRPVHGLAGAL